MPTATFLEKAYGPFHPGIFEPIFLALCKGLNVSVKVVGKTDRGWIQVDVSGEDRAVALRFLDQEIGLAPVSADTLKRFSVIRGRAISSGERRDGLRVDVGVFSPRHCEAVISLRKLQAQLADGKKLPLNKLLELYCLYDNLPLRVKLVNDLNAQKANVEAELSEAQLSQFSHWISVFLDRLIVLGAQFSDVDRVIKVSRSARDVVKVESLGFLEHAVVCKLGTDAVGLIPRFGRFLPTATLVPFSPRGIQKVVNRLSL